MSTVRHTTGGGGKATAQRLSRVASCFLLGVALCCLLGADIDFAPGSPVPNPNNLPLTIEGSGPFKLEKGEQLSYIRFYAKHKASGQIVTNFAQIDFNTMTWKQKLLVNPAGDYICYAVMQARDLNNNITTIVGTEFETITVK